jgi:hypothetical protein
MISVVNGYVCTSSCEAASARAGKDPNAPPGTPPGQSGKTGKTSGLDGQPATVLGGALNDIAPANAVTPAGGTTPPQKPLLNLLA